MAVTVIDEENTVPLMVLESDGSLQVVVIPHLSEQGFKFLRELLVRYKPAIVPKAKHPPEDG